MYSLKSSLVLLLLWPTLGLSTHFAEVEFIINVPADTPPESSIYLTGNRPELCHWQADCLKLEKISAHQFRILQRFNISQNNKLQFKITRGDWNSEASQLNGTVLSNQVKTLTQARQQVLLNISNWKDLGAYQVSGQIQRFSIYSQKLKKERTVTLWWPADKELEEIEDVLVFHDGQNAFSPQRSAVGLSWQLDRAVSRLMKQDKIPPVLIVAIDSDHSRNQDFDWFQNGKAYLDFITKELVTDLKQNYGIVFNPRKTYTMGSSWGAYTSFVLLTQRPDFFIAASGLSFPAHGFNMTPIRYLQSFEKLPDNIHFFFDHGTHGGDRNYTSWNQLFLQNLHTRIDQENKEHFKYQIFPFTGHSEIEWARRVEQHIYWLTTRSAE